MTEILSSKYSKRTNNLCPAHDPKWLKEVISTFELKMSPKKREILQAHMIAQFTAYAANVFLVHHIIKRCKHF